MKKQLLIALSTALLASPAVVLAADAPAAAPAATAGAAAPAQPPVTPERAQNAVKEVDMLFSRTSAAKQVGTSKEANGSSEMKEAQSLREQAHKALAAQQYAEAIRLSNEAKKAFFSTTRKADPDTVLEEKRKRDFEQRKESLGALADALKREATALKKDAGPALKDIEKLTKEADGLAAQKKYAEGRKVLDQAYVTAKVGIEAIKRGTTVEAQKDTSPKGIYDYEAFRNETYQSLIGMVVDERKKAGIESDQMFLDDVKEGDNLRAAGLALSKGGDFVEATRKLGESTSKYKKAVRRAGVQIID